MIKTFHLQDVISLAKLQAQGNALDLEERLVHPRSPLGAALLAALLPSIPATSTFILDFSDESDRYRGLIQTRERPDRPEQDVVFLAPSLEYGNGSHAVWQRLLTHVCVKAGEAGHHRIYARFEQGGDEIQIFKNVGFSAYAEEEVFQLTPANFPKSINDTLGLRKQTTADSWSLQRLYAAVTPRAVQIAEGLAQGQWQLNVRFSTARRRRSGYVWEREGEILAVLHVHTGRAGYGLRLLIHPDVSDQAADLIEAGLCLVENSRRRLDKPIFSSLRTYQSEMGSVLSDYGFQKINTQVVMVKHTTVRAKDVLSRLVTFEASAEAKPATPAPFLNSDVVHSTPSDGAMAPNKAAENGI